MFVEVYCIPDTVKCLECISSILGDSFHLFILYFFNDEILATCWLACSSPCGLKLDSQGFLEGWQVGYSCSGVSAVRV